METPYAIVTPYQLSLCTHNSDHSLDNYFSISVQFFSPNGPSFFCHHDSPSNLAESRYPRPHPSPVECIDPKNSIFKNRKFAVKLYDLNRFFAIFCDFPPQIKLDTGKRLEMTWNIYPFHMTSCVNGFPFRYSGEAKTNTVKLYRINLEGWT